MTKLYFQVRESKVIEFKSTVQRFESIIKTAVAFANGIGADILPWLKPMGF